MTVTAVRTRPRATLPTASATDLVSALQTRASAQPTPEEVRALLDAALYAPLRGFVARPGKGIRGRLSALAYRLAGGEGTPNPWLPLIAECLHAGSLIIDDIEDASESRRGQPTLHRLCGMPVALNAGNFLYFMPHFLLRHSGLPAGAQLRVHDAIGQCLLDCHEGQALDLTVRLSQLSPGSVPDVVREVSARKTGALMGLSMAMGAIAAGGDPDMEAALHGFGMQVGIGLQLLDDLSGIINPNRVDKGLEDLRGDRATWAWVLLSEDLEPDGYDGLLDEHRRCFERCDCSGLLDRMRFPLAQRGPERARAHLEAAVNQLFSHLGPSPLRAGVQAELNALQQRFLEG